MKKAGTVISEDVCRYRSTYIYIYLYIFIFIYIFTYIYIIVLIYKFLFIFILIYIYIFIYMYLFISIFVSSFIDIEVKIHVCSTIFFTCVSICIYKCASPSFDRRVWFALAKTPKDIDHSTSTDAEKKQKEQLEEFAQIHWQENRRTNRTDVVYTD